MQIESIKIFAKWGWISGILIFVSIFAIEKRETLASALVAIPIESMLCAVLLILGAKLCLVSNLKTAAKKFGIVVSWREGYRIYNLTQLAKYIPGSIWQFVGRIAILREKNISSIAIRNSLLAEHFWVLGVATLLAIIFSLKNIQEFIYFLSVKQALHSPVLMLIVIVFLVGLILFSIIKRNLLHSVVNFSPPIFAVLTLVIAWFLFGTSLWITTLPFLGESESTFLYIVGVYCFAFVSGFFVPFAPAGIGVREAVLVFALSPYLETDTAILLAAINRVNYLASEIILVLVYIPSNVSAYWHRIQRR